MPQLAVVQRTLQLRVGYSKANQDKLQNKDMGATFALFARMLVVAATTTCRSDNLTMTETQKEAPHHL